MDFYFGLGIEHIFLIENKIENSNKVNTRFLFMWCLMAIKKLNSFYTN